MVLLQPGGPVLFLLDISQGEPGPDATTGALEFAKAYSLWSLPGAEEALHWLTENARIYGVRVSHQHRWR